MTTAQSWSWGRDEPESMSTVSHTSFLIAVLTVAFALLWRRRKAGEASLPPGPHGLPLLGNLPFLRPDLHRYLADLARTYGPVMRLQLGAKVCIVLSSPDAVKEALKDRDDVFGDHDVPAVALLVFGGKGILWQPNGPHWRMIRKLAVRELISPTALEGLHSVRQREVQRMVEKLRRKAGTAVDLRELVFATTLNAMTMMLWGATVAEDGGEDAAKVKEFRQAVDAVGELEGLPNVSDFFPALARLDLQGLGRRIRREAAWIDRTLSSIIDHRLRTAEGGGDGEGAAASNGRDFLQAMVELVRKPQAALTLEHVKALLLDLITAGTDTTSATVEWAMTELLSNPEKMMKAKVEVATVVGKDSMVEESHLPKLHYLDAVVKEVHRLHPVAPLLIPHHASSSSTIAGHRIPKGSKVIINAWAIHRDPQLWDDASRFEPERFLGACDKLEYNGNSYLYIPFGTGRRICAGIPLGERMIKYILASLLHSTEWTLPEGVRLDLIERFGVVVKKKQALVAVPTLPYPYNEVCV